MDMIVHLLANVAWESTREHISSFHHSIGVYFPFYVKW